MRSLFSPLTGALQPGTNGRLSGATSTVPWVLPMHLDTPRAVMIKMVLPTDDLLLPGRWVHVPYPDCRVQVDVGCLATSPQFTGSLRILMRNGF